MARHIALTAADVVMIRDALAILEPEDLDTVPRHLQGGGCVPDDEDGDRARDRCGELQAIFDELADGGAPDFTLTVEEAEADDDDARCPSSPDGRHDFPRNIEESERCLCTYCGADGDG